MADMADPHKREPDPDRRRLQELAEEDQLHAGALEAEEAFFKDTGFPRMPEPNESDPPVDHELLRAYLADELPEGSPELSLVTRLTVFCHNWRTAYANAIIAGEFGPRTGDDARNGSEQAD